MSPSVLFCLLDVQLEEHLTNRASSKAMKAAEAWNNNLKEHVETLVNLVPDPYGASVSIVLNVVSFASSVQMYEEEFTQ